MPECPTPKKPVVTAFFKNLSGKFFWQTKYKESKNAMQECKNKQEYLEQIIEPVRRCCKRYGYLPSVLIAQSCLENGYGVRAYWDNPQIEALIGVNNMVGLKRELLNSSWVPECSVWDGTYINKSTPEVYGGVPVTVKADFRKYDSVERSFSDYLCFMTYASNEGKGGKPKYGPEILNEKDPATLIGKVSDRGYATGPTYRKSIMRIVNEHNLTQYDDLTGVTPTDIIPEVMKREEQQKQQPLVINKHLMQMNHTAKTRGKGSIKWIVVHYVGALGGAYDNVCYYASTKLKASADFWVGFQGEIWQGNDYYNYYSWHCGGGYQSYWTQNGGGKYYKQCTNENSIGIEMCVRKVNTKQQLATDTDWYFEEATVNSTAALVAKLMHELDIDINHVIMHYHVNRKICPNPFVVDNNKWLDFLNRVQKAYDGTPYKEPDWYRVRKSWADAASQTGAYEYKENAIKECKPGYAVYDSKGNEIYRNNEKPSANGYRVRVGIFSNRLNVNRIKKNIKAKTGLDCFEETKADGVHVYCGSFDTDGAECQKRVNTLNKAGFKTELEAR